MTDDNSVLVGFIYRKDGLWSVYNATKLGPGKVFSECEDLIKNNLKHAGFDEALLLDSKKWSAGSGRKFVLEKDQTICIPNGLREIRVGLCWDTRCDIDASVILLNA